MDNAFAKPVEAYTEARPSLVTSDMPSSLPNEPEIPINPTLHEHLTGKTYLGKMLNIENDDEKSQFVNRFILRTMDIEELSDSDQGYSTVLDRMLQSIGLSKAYKSEFIVEKLYYYLLGNSVSPQEKLTLNILQHG